MFEKASRLKLKFETSKGQLSVEDLWDLPLTSTTGKANLDDIARDLYQQTKNEDISFVKQVSKVDETVQLKFEIVKHIITVRVAENEAASNARAVAAKKQQIMELIAERENDALRNTSVEDLRKLLESL